MTITFKRKVTWTLAQILFWLPAFCWIFYGNVYAGNWVKFYVGLYLFVSLFVFSERVKKQVQKKGLVGGPRLNFYLDFGFGVFLAIFGHFVLAAMVVTGAILQQGFYHESQN